MAIHPMAVVDPTAEVHEDATVGPFCVVGAHVRIDAGAELRNHVTVYGTASIGSGTVVFPGAVIGGDPQDLKFKGEDSRVEIGKNCRIHECATINKGTAGGGMVTSLGDECLIMAYAHIAHDCRLADYVIIGNNSQLAGHVTIERKAIVSGMAGVHHFATIGELAFVAGMSGVRVDVPPFMMVEGYPAEPRQVNVVGLRRDGWSDEEIRATKDAFRSLYRDRGATTLAEAAEKLKAGPTGEIAPVKRLCDWVEAQ
jgi:UDP-N-acetylglucosamine acyltransferase